jgi:hypothetical protein
MIASAVMSEALRSVYFLTDEIEHQRFNAESAALLNS